MGEQARFLCNFPPIQSALKIGIDGMRLQLDVPESEMDKAVLLLAWRDRVLDVTIRPLKNTTGTRQDDATTVMAKGTVRKSQWKTAENEGADGDTGTGGKQDPVCGRQEGCS